MWYAIFGEDVPDSLALRAMVRAAHLERVERLVAEGIINHPVTGNAVVSRKCVRHDSDGKVPLAVPCPGMPGMQMALILDKNLVGIECGP